MRKNFQKTLHKGSKKVLSLLLCATMLAGINTYTDRTYNTSATVYAKNSVKPSSSVIKTAYMNYAKKLQKKNKKKDLYYAVIHASEKKQPVLLISNGVMDYDNLNPTTNADVYSYNGKKVVYITHMESTGTAYPLVSKGKYIISGWHHKAQRLVVSGNKGYEEETYGFYTEPGNNCYYKKWTVKNGKKSNVVKKKITLKEAEDNDYYSTTGTKIISFKKVK